jgi:hypothetical protein
VPIGRGKRLPPLVGNRSDGHTQRMQSALLFPPTCGVQQEVLFVLVKYVDTSPGGGEKELNQIFYDMAMQGYKLLSVVPKTSQGSTQGLWLFFVKS